MSCRTRWAEIVACVLEQGGKRERNETVLCCRIDIFNYYRDSSTDGSRSILRHSPTTPWFYPSLPGLLAVRSASKLLEKTSNVWRVRAWGAMLHGGVATSATSDRAIRQTSQADIRGRHQRQTSEADIPKKDIASHHKTDRQTGITGDQPACGGDRLPQRVNLWKGRERRWVWSRRRRRSPSPRRPPLCRRRLRRLHNKTSRGW